MDMLYTQVVKAMPQEALENKKCTAEVIQQFIGV